MDLTSRLRSIVRPPNAAPRELTYEPDMGRYEATIDIDRVADVLGGQVVENRFGRALIVDRRYESDRFHGARRVGDCDVADGGTLALLDPALPPLDGAGSRTLFVDLETTGLSGGAGTVAFLVGCGWFDMGAFQVRQFLLTSYASERALLCAVAECLGATSLLVTYNGKTFDVPVMETRWLFHRMPLPLESVRHFDMLHPARRLWGTRGLHASGMERPATRPRNGVSASEGPEGTAAERRPRAPNEEGGCRLGTLERVLCDVTRVGDIPGMDIPARYFRFLRSGDARPLEPVLEHNRLDLISLAAVCAHAVQLVDEGTARCRDAAEALALGKVYERAGSVDRAMAAYEHAAADPSAHVDVVLEAIYRLGLRLRRDRRFTEAADCWRRLLDVKQARLGRRSILLAPLRQYAVEALAIHHEHRERDYEGAKELTLRLLDECDEGSLRPKTEATRHRLARLERKIAGKNDSHLFGGCL
jgi:uncharacterized protein YprB with RNaseH-like and TPR domain